MLSVYDVSVPVFIRALRNLSAVLDKGEEFAHSTGHDPLALASARLIEDMLPLTGQIQRATDSAKGAAARLSGNEIPSFPDEEQTFDDMRARIARTIAYLETITPEQLEGGETRQVTINSRRKTQEMIGRDYLLKFALPNFFFHITTAYDILRHKGVPLAKMDYIGEI